MKKSFRVLIFVFAILFMIFGNVKNVYALNEAGAGGVGVGNSSSSKLAGSSTKPGSSTLPKSSNGTSSMAATINLKYTCGSSCNNLPSTSSAPKKGISGVAFKISSVIPVRNGYSFMFWYSQNSKYAYSNKCTNEIKKTMRDYGLTKCKTSITLKKNKTLYAIWKNNRTNDLAQESEARNNFRLIIAPILAIAGFVLISYGVFSNRPLMVDTKNRNSKSSNSKVKSKKG